MNKCKFLLKILQEDDKSVVIDQFKGGNNQETIARDRGITTSITKLGRYSDRLNSNVKKGGVSIQV